MRSGSGWSAPTYRPGEIYLGWTRVGEALAGELRGRNARTQQQLSIAVGSRLSAQQEEVGAISTAPKREKNNERSLRELVATASTLAHILLRGFQKRERRCRQSSGIHPPCACEENFARPPPTQHSSHFATAQQWKQRHRFGSAAGSKSRKAFLDSGEFGARIPAEALPSHPALYGQRGEEILPAPPLSHLTMAPASGT